jgi:HK97 gp10 family phage protein
MSVIIKKTGFNMAGLSRRVRGNIADVLNGGAESCVSLGQQLAPVSEINTPGYVHMKDRIKQTEEATVDNLKVTMESQADYSVFVEYGTINMEAQPFMTPAFESARKQVNNGLLRALK